MHKNKSFEIKVIEKSADGGRIQITTGGVDRDKDRVMPMGGRLENYLKNSVVQWSHIYSEPFATIGRSDSLEVNADGIVASFTLRPAANDQDPQNIVRLLWEGGWVKTASIGFIPIRADSNDFGGLDFHEWELLEWSLTPVPSQPAAIALAEKQYPAAFKSYQAEIEKRGRVLSAANEAKIKQAHENLGAVLEQITSDEDDDDKTADPLAALAKQVSELHTKLDALLVARDPVPDPIPDPIDYTDTLAKLRAFRAATNPVRS